jgi:hypothetical protein
VVTATRKKPKEEKPSQGHTHTKEEVARAAIARKGMVIHR